MAERDQHYTDNSSLSTMEGQRRQAEYEREQAFRQEKERAYAEAQRISNASGSYSSGSYSSGGDSHSFTPLPEVIRNLAFIFGGLGAFLAWKETENPIIAGIVFVGVGGAVYLLAALIKVAIHVLIFLFKLAAVGLVLLFIVAALKNAGVV